MVNIGGFAIRRDYRNRDVLLTSRAIAGAPWTLIYKIDREEALSANEARISNRISEAFLAIVVIMTAFIAVWRHGASKRAAQSATRFKDLAARYEAQERILRLVTDCQPSPLYILDGDNRFRFANRATATRAKLAESDLIGKTLASVIGPAESSRYEALNRDVLDSGRSQSDIHRSGDSGEARVIRAEHIPVPNLHEHRTGVMVMEQDITPVIRERERREHTLDRLVETLVAVVDRRDPYAANHSARVSTVARAISDEMALDAVTAETAATADNLMNLGKIQISPDLLTHPEELGDDDLRQIREGLLGSADLLQGIEFDGPVVETLRQFQERWDGGGPRGLAGENILISARVVAVANAFVAMISPRAWREGAGVDEAIEKLMADAGIAYDRSVVVALVNRLDNRGGRTDWGDFLGEPN